MPEFWEQDEKIEPFGESDIAVAEAGPETFFAQQPTDPQSFPAVEPKEVVNTAMQQGIPLVEAEKRTLQKKAKESLAGTFWGNWLKLSIGFANIPQSYARVLERASYAPTAPYAGLIPSSAGSFAPMTKGFDELKLAEQQEKTPITDQIENATDWLTEGAKYYIKKHPEWQGKPAESFIDLITSPDKFAHAIVGSIPMLIGAGLMTATGHPIAAFHIAYAAEGQDAADQAAADNRPIEEQELARIAYGLPAAAIEFAQLTQGLKIGKEAYRAILGRMAKEVGEDIVETGGKKITKDFLMTLLEENVEEWTQGMWQEETARLIYGKEQEGGFMDFLNRRLMESAVITPLVTMGAGAGAVVGFAGRAKETAETAPKAAEITPTQPAISEKPPTPAVIPPETIVGQPEAKYPQTPEDAQRAVRIFQMYQETGDEGLLEDLPPGAEIKISPEDVSLALVKALETPAERKAFKDNLIQAAELVESGEATKEELASEVVAYQKVWGEKDPLPDGLLRYIGLSELVKQPSPPSAAKQAWKMTSTEYANQAKQMVSEWQEIVKKSPTESNKQTLKSWENVVANPKQRHREIIENKLRFKKPDVPINEFLPPEVLTEYPELAKTKPDIEGQGKFAEPSPMEIGKETEKQLERKVSRIVSGTIDRAIEEGIKADYEGTPDYEPEAIAPGVQKIRELQKTDPEYVKRIALGLENPPAGIRTGWAFSVVRDDALRAGDAATIYELSHSKPAAELATEKGREVKAYDAIDSLGRVNPVKAIQGIREIREQSLEKRGKKTKTEKQIIAKQIKESIRKTSSRSETWTEFIKSIQC